MKRTPYDFPHYKRCIFVQERFSADFLFLSPEEFRDKTLLFNKILIGDNKVFWYQKKKGFQVGGINYGNLRIYLPILFLMKAAELFQV